MQRNKYLDKLGIPIEDYGANFTNGNKKSRKIWKEQRKDYGFDSRECYDLGRTFLEWMYSHLQLFLHDAGKIVDLKDGKRTIQFDDKTYTLEQAINYMLLNLETALTINDLDDSLCVESSKNAIFMWAEFFPYAWW